MQNHFLELSTSSVDYFLVNIHIYGFIFMI